MQERVQCTNRGSVIGRLGPEWCISLKADEGITFGADGVITLGAGGGAGNDCGFGVVLGGGCCLG